MLDVTVEALALNLSSCTSALSGAALAIAYAFPNEINARLKGQCSPEERAQYAEERIVELRRIAADACMKAGNIYRYWNGPATYEQCQIARRAWADRSTPGPRP